MNDNGTNNQDYKIPKWIIGILLLSLLLNVVTYFRVGSLKEEIWKAQNNLASINGSISGTVASNMNMIKEMLKKEASLIADYKFEIGEYKDKRIDILLNVKPKAYTEGDKLYFSYKSGNEEPFIVEAQTLDKINFESKINVSVMNDIELDLIIENGINRKNEKLETIYRPLEKFTANLSAHPMGGTMAFDKDKGALVISYGFDLIDISGGNNRYRLNDVILAVEVNGNLIATETIPNIDYSRYSIQLKDYKIPCKSGDIIDIYIKAKDDKGFSYSSLVESWKIGANGSIDSSGKMAATGRMEIE